jgi:hypothetical protein
MDGKTGSGENQRQQENKQDNSHNSLQSRPALVWPAPGVGVPRTDARHTRLMATFDAWGTDTAGKYWA